MSPPQDPPRGAHLSPYQKGSLDIRVPPCQSAPREHPPLSVSEGDREPQLWLGWGWGSKGPDVMLVRAGHLQGQLGACGADGTAIPAWLHCYA